MLAMSLRHGLFGLVLLKLNLRMPIGSLVVLPLIGVWFLGAGRLVSGWFGLVGIRS